MLREKIKKVCNISDRTINIIQLIGTIGLTVTMVILIIVMFKYMEILKVDPCSLCDKTLINNFTRLIE